jgi:hypothetical protein
VNSRESLVPKSKKAFCLLLVQNPIATVPDRV